MAAPPTGGQFCLFLLRGMLVTFSVFYFFMCQVILFMAAVFLVINEEGTYRFRRCVLNEPDWLVFTGAEALSYSNNIFIDRIFKIARNGQCLHYL